MYRVIKGFFDLQDGDRWYDIGETYPRAGYKPTEKRIAELAGKNNRQQTALIEEVKTAKPEAPEEEPVIKKTKAAKKKKD